MKKFVALIVTALVLVLSAPAAMAFESLIPYDKGECFRSMPWADDGVRSAYITSPEHTVSVEHEIYYWKGGNLYGPISFYCAEAPEPAVIVDETFVVFFDFDMSNIRPDQVGTLEDAVAYAKMYGGANVMLSAFCDFRGTDPYNDALGDRRAASVKAWMVENGVDPNRISSESFGEQRSPVRDLVGRFCEKCFEDRRVEIQIK